MRPLLRRRFDVGGGPDDGILVSDLYRSGSSAFAVVLRLFAEGQGNAELRAIGSLWSCRFLALLIPPALLGPLLVNWSYPLDPTTMRVKIDPSGAPMRLILPFEGRNVCPDAAEKIVRDLLELHVAPLAAVIQTAAGTPRQVVWSNAANLVDHCLGVARRQPDRGGTRRDVCAQVAQLGHAEWRGPRSIADFVDNVRTDDGLRRRRRVCCLCFELAECGFCVDCPAGELRGLPRHVDG
ncbi:siderophore-iron reductase FhuF [Amorphus sp. 3PC139-8]